MTKTYRAGVYKNLKERLVAVEDWPLPEVGPKDVLIKTIRTSFCGSDTGAMGPDVDKEFGHETVARVVEVGSEVAGFKVGDRVWPHGPNILGGRYSCQLPGFSEFILVHDPTPKKQLWHVPDSITDNQACLIEPFGVGTRGKNRPGAKVGDNVVVYGAGSIGLLCLSALVAQGITPVVIDIILSDYKRALLKEMGVIVAPLPEEGDKIEFIKELWGELPQRQSGTALNVDIVVDCAGAPNVVEDFFKMRKENSRLVTLGINRPQEVPLAYMMSSEMVIMGSSGYNESDLDEVFDNLANNKVPWIEKIITHHYKQDQLQEGLNMAMNREEAIKVVIDME